VVLKPGVEAATPQGDGEGLAPDPVPAGSTVPEPGSVFLLALAAGVAGLIVAKRKMRNPRTVPVH